MTLLRDLTAEFEQTINDSLGDEITYTPSGGAPVTFNAWVEIDTTILNPGNSSASVDEITVEVPMAKVPDPIGTDVFTVTILPGMRWLIKKRLRSNTGATWVLALKRQMVAALSGAVNALSSATGQMRGDAAFDGASQATSGVAGGMRGDAALAGTQAAVSSAAGGMAAFANLVGTSSAAAIVAGTMAGAAALIGTAAAVSALSGGMAGNAKLAGTSAAQSTMSGAGTLAFTYDFTGGSMPAGATLTRASAGYRMNVSGVLVSEAIDVARFDYDVSHALLGLLVEPAITNLLTQSQAFDNAAWAKSGTTVTANSLSAPDGTTTADTLVESSGTANHLCSRNPTTTAVTHTLSCIVKSKERTRFYLGLQLGGTFPGAYFDLSAVSVLSFGSGITARIASIGGGFYRCSVSGLTTASTPEVDVAPILTNNYNYNGDGTSGIYVWQAQLEARATATSIVPSAGSAGTRSADVLTLNAPNGTYNVRYTFDDLSTQTVSTTVSGGVLTVPNTLNRFCLRKVESL